MRADVVVKESGNTYLLLPKSVVDYLRLKDGDSLSIDVSQCWPDTLTLSRPEQPTLAGTKYDGRTDKSRG